MVEKGGWWSHSYWMPWAFGPGPWARGRCVNKGSGGAAQQELRTFGRPGNRDLVEIPVHKEWRLLSKLLSEKQAWQLKTQCQFP